MKPEKQNFRYDDIEAQKLDILEGDKKRKKERSAWLIVSFAINLLFFLAIGLLLSDASVRFALFHNQEASTFANGYYRVEKEAKQAANDVLKDWVNSNKVK